jgi:hypothetical protein
MVIALGVPLAAAFAAPETAGAATATPAAATPQALPGSSANPVQQLVDDIVAAGLNGKVIDEDIAGFLCNYAGIGGQGCLAI